MGIKPLEIPQVNRLRRPEKLEALYRYFLDSQETGDLRQETANLLVQLMLVEVATSSIQNGGDSDKVNSHANSVHNYIWMNNDNNLTTKLVAEALGFNPDYLGRIYRKVYGYTITQAIHQSRIARACRLLMDSDMTIEEVARDCGFSDADYFRRVFRRYKHITPIAFRKINSRIYVNTD
ncbi:MAG: helix-turn-helix transcriptional regulator [Anaerolineae bacterium]|nr:helix-turn-helix transcriptional regulator [Anaerolineae bacterium]